MKPLNYKNYIAKLEYDDEDGIFYGKVININDSIEFKGSSVEELRKEFKESVDAYLEFCQELGDEPEKPFSGNFHIRAYPELHRSLFIEAKLEGKSFNSYVVDILEHHKPLKNNTTKNIYINRLHVPGPQAEFNFSIEQSVKSKEKSLNIVDYKENLVDIIQNYEQ